MEDINLHFTGDFHAITSAHNLLSALIDNHIYWGNALGIDERRIAWRRVMDMNDRALRSIVGSLGGVANGFPREDGFDITVASEIMAIFCLATDLKDLEKRIGNIVVGYTRERKPITAKQLKGDGAMTVLLKDALMPNLVQTLENNPVFIHGGPFANIAHGCNSVLATKTALKLCDYVVTEAGFGADLGAEKFFDIKCRKAGLKPAAAVIVATVRALKMHGGVAKDDLKGENVGRRRQGLRQPQAPHREREEVRRAADRRHQQVHHRHRRRDRRGDEGRREHGREGVPVRALGQGRRPASRRWPATSSRSPTAAQSNFTPLYPDEMPLWDKVKTIATEIYGASDIVADTSVRNQFKDLQVNYGHLPVCMAKTQYSFSTDPEPARRAVGPRGAGARAAPVGRRGVHRRHHRRHHDDAGPAARAERGHDPPQRQGPDRRPVLIDTRCQTLRVSRNDHSLTWAGCKSSPFSFGNRVQPTLRLAGAGRHLATLGDIGQCPAISPDFRLEVRTDRPY